MPKLRTIFLHRQKPLTGLHSTAGFSLVEALVTVGIMTFVALGVASLIGNIMSATLTQKYTYGVNDLGAQVRADLSNSTACVNTFGGTAMSAAMNTGFTKIMTKNGVVLFATGTAAAGPWYEDNSVYLKSINLQTYNSVSATSGYATVSLQLGARSNNVYGSATLPFTVQLEATVDATGKLINCVALAAFTDGIWQLVPATNQDIFYMGPVTGNVGIGKAAPLYALDVTGNTAFTGMFNSTNAGRARLGIYNISGANTSGVLDMGTGGNAWEFGTDLNMNGGDNLYMWDANGGGNTRFFIDNLGNVGIGTTIPNISVGMAGGLGINGTNSTQLTIQKSGTLSFALNASATNPGDFTLYDAGGGVWNQSITSNKGTVGIGTTNPDTTSSMEIYSPAEGYIRLGKGHDMHWNGGNDSWFTFVSDAGAAGKTTFSDSFAHNFLTMLNSTGYLGINNAMPNKNLDVGGSIRASGKVGSGGFDPDTGYPGAWGGGVHTWDVYAEGSVGLGTGGTLQTWMNSTGNAFFSGYLTAGDLTSNGFVTIAGGMSVAGYATFNGGYGASDRRLKKEIKEMNGGQLDNVKKLAGVYYHWIKPPPEPNLLYPPPKREIGFIAQDVQKLFPETVRANRDGYLSLDYSKLIVPVVEAFKELDTKVEHLEHENQDLKQRVEKLEKSSGASSH